MRILIFFLFVLCSATVAEADDGFSTFMKSREVVATLYFPANSDDLVAADRERVAALVTQLRQLQHAGRLIRVEGFSSPEGDREGNFRLSFFRARTVAELIETKGLPAEVTLTGYGDLRVTSADPFQERRVEIASYLKPAGLKRVKVAGEGDENRSASSETPLAGNEIDLQSVDRAIKGKLGDHGRQFADKDLPGPLAVPGMRMSSLAEEPVIDALTIEQALMEKLAAEPPLPAGTVSQVRPAF